MAAILLFFTARRWLFLFGALLPDKPPQREPEPPQALRLPDVLLLVPVRNEAQSLPGLLPALDQFIYPGHALTIVFINDGSTDNSQAILQGWTAPRPNWHLLSLAHNVGKANALNAALAQFPAGEIVAVYDADERPRPDALQHLARPFAGKRVGGVSGRRVVGNRLAGPAAGYTAIEGLVHQLVTMRAKDRLNLAPALLGANCAYRRVALAAVGYFQSGALLEDSDLTLKLTRAGWRLHFEPEAVSDHQAPETIAGYWKQHTRWARGFNQVAGTQIWPLFFDRRLPLLLRLELLAFSLGYLDRLALLAGVALFKNRVAAWAVSLSLLTPLLQVMAALKIAGEPAVLWRQMVWLPFFFAIDVAMALNGFWHTVRRAPPVWDERAARK